MHLRQRLRHRLHMGCSLILIFVLIFTLCIPAFAEGEPEEGPAAEVSAEPEAPEDTEAPETEAPETEAPETEAPETEAPAAQEPETEPPAPQEPETEPPKPAEPETEPPKPAESETEAPKPAEPETEPPKPAESETEAPKPAEPETEAPEPEDSEAKVSDGPTVVDDNDEEDEETEEETEELTEEEKKKKEEEEKEEEEKEKEERRKELLEEIEVLIDQHTNISGGLNELIESYGGVTVTVADLDEQMSDVYTQLDSLAAQLEETVTALEDNRAEINYVQFQIEQGKIIEKKQYDALVARIRAMYMNQERNLLLVFLAAENLADILNMEDYVSRISEYDRQLLEALITSRTYVENLEQQLYDREEELKRLTSTLEALIANQNAKKEELEKVMATKYSQMESIAASMSNFYDAILTIENSIRVREEEYIELGGSASSLPTLGVPGNMSYGSYHGTVPAFSYSGYVYPCAAGDVVSGFGPREAPTAGASTYHMGIDISAPMGTDILASAPGTIILTAYSTARGNYVIIDHGNGVKTLYQHCSAIYVTAGQSVKQGQAIAAVGTTGISTGPHLHYEVFLNDVNVNPISYIGS